MPVRRRLAEDPTSQLALWSRRCALFALAVTILAIIIVRSGLVETLPGMATLGGGLAVAALAILLAFAAFVVIWQTGAAGGAAALTGLVIGIAILAYPGYLATRAYKLPPINDITTDPQDAPRFEVVARLRPPGTAAYARANYDAQRAAYPDIEPLSVTAAPQIAYEEAVKVITKRKWRILADRPPQAGRRDGIIEAVARTTIMGFRDDVVVRIRATPDGARIDARSASRTSQPDLGTNAARIKTLLDDIDDAVTVRESRPERPPPRPAQPAPGTRPAAPAQSNAPARR